MSEKGNEPIFTPCGLCQQGRHDDCGGGLCNCRVEHVDDDPVMRGFKRFKRMSSDEQQLSVLAWLMDRDR